MTKYLLIGLGAVGKSFLRILVEQNLFDRDSFFCIDPDPNVESAFLSYGGLSSHYICARLTENTYLDYLEEYNSGDYVFNFANNIKDIALLELSIKSGFHYISLSDSNWDPYDPTWISAHQHFLEYKKILKRCKKTINTSILEFGMNPGLVSVFAKKCIEHIVNTEQNPFFQLNRKKLQSLIAKGRYGKVAKIIGVEYVVEIDNDDQIYTINQENGYIYSPWSPTSFLYESLSAPEISFGTRKQFYQFEEVRDCDFHDFYVSLPYHGIDCRETAFSPQGEVEGALITHEEVFSISKLFTSGRYKPTVYFVYSPCHIAEKSVQDNRENLNASYKLLERKDLVQGGESVGIILQGRNFKTSYYGNYLDCSSTDETPTVLQVSASAFAAYKYIYNHPNEGVLFPEDVEADEVLETASKYLGVYQFLNCPDVIPRFSNCSK